MMHESGEEADSKPIANVRFAQQARELGKLRADLREIHKVAKLAESKQREARELQRQRSELAQGDLAL
jgi:hypothetical protein